MRMRFKSTRPRHIGIALAIATFTIAAAYPRIATARIQQPGKAPAEASLPDTPAGRTLGKFLAAFNTGDEKVMKQFHREQGGNEGNSEKDMGFFKESGGLKVVRVERTSDFEIEVIASAVNGDGWFKFGIQVAREAPHAIISVRVNQAQAPSSNSEGAISTASSAPKTSFENVTERLDAFLKSREAEDVFSGVVLIARDGQPMYKKAVGLASKEYNVPNLIDTKFNLGSINKIFTRIAIMQLVEAGQLSLSDTVGKHLADYPNKQAIEKVTVRHLLEMESGIGDIFGAKFDATPKNRLRSIADYLPLFADQPLAFEPGTRRAYSNGGYVVLGAIIERITRGSYYDYVREHIFKPAGMNDTDYYQADENTPNLASGYARDKSTNRRLNNFYTRPARGSSAGGGYSTAPDLLKFTIALQGNKLLSAQGTRNILGGGLGIAGGAPGINAALEVSRENIVIVMSNYDPPSALEVSQQVRKLLGMD